MFRASNGHIAARKLLDNCGLDDIIDMQLDLFVAGLDAILIEEPLANCDGKIIFGSSKAIIKVNSGIQYPERKRFVVSHEIGHLMMHRNLELPEDTFSTLNVISGMENALKYGKQELEANNFASALLMPEKKFLAAARDKKFSPLLIQQLAQQFKTSLTATIFRYFELNLYPLCVVWIENGKVKYCKKPDDMRVYPKNIYRLPPPSDSVAAEYLANDYAYLYKMEEKAQIINKSTWFNIYENDEDSQFYEYCIPTKRYRTILSLIWED